MSHLYDSGYNIFSYTNFKKFAYQSKNSLYFKNLYLHYTIKHFLFM